MPFPPPLAFFPFLGILLQQMPSTRRLSSNELTTGKYLKMADSFCGFVSKQRLFMSRRSVQIGTYEGREGDHKEVFLKNVSL